MHLILLNENAYKDPNYINAFFGLLTRIEQYMRNGNIPTEILSGLMTPEGLHEYATYINGIKIVPLKGIIHHYHRQAEEKEINIF